MNRIAFAALLTLSGVCLAAPALRAQVPVCGLANNQNPYIPGTNPSGGTSNYDTFTAPTIGNSYVDALGGCTVTRITNGAVESNYYSSISPFSADDKFMLVSDNSNGAAFISTAPAYEPTFTPGTVVVTEANMPSNATPISKWDWTDGTSFYYTSGKALIKGTITGLPSCISTHTCTVSNTTVHTFTEYNSINFPDEPDLAQDGVSIPFIGYNSSGSSTMDIATWNVMTSAKTVFHTTTCTGTPGNQPGCVHKTQTDPKGGMIVVYTNNCNTNPCNAEQGEWDYPVSGAGWSAEVIDPFTEHMDSGFNLAGTTPIFVKTRIDTNSVWTTTDPCPSGQWTGSSAAGGSTLATFTDPLNASSTAVCFFNVDFASNHFSYRGGATQPWITVSFYDGRNPGPEWFTTNGNYTAPTCTQINTRTSGTCWYPMEDEIDMVRANTNMNSVCSSCLATIYRLAQARSRSQENFWAQVQASMSRDGKYIAFTSNMAFRSGSCSSPGTSGCTDVYVVSGANGGPLFAPTTGTNPAPVMIVSASPLPAGAVGSPYNFTLSATGGTPPYKWTGSGAPGGVSLSIAGVLSGTPTTAAAYSLAVTMADSSTPPLTASATLALTINPAAVTPQYTLSSLEPSLNFSGVAGGANPPAQAVSIVDNDPACTPYTASVTQAWLAVNPSNSCAGGPTLSVAANIAGLAPNTYNGALVITAPLDLNSPFQVPVTLTLNPGTMLKQSCKWVSSNTLWQCQASGVPVGGSVSTTSSSGGASATNTGTRP